MVEIIYQGAGLSPRPLLQEGNIISVSAEHKHCAVSLKANRMDATPFETETDTQEDYDFRSRLAEYVSSQALPIDKLGHQPRLYALTQLVGQGMSYDDDVVYAAAWLHDLGVFIGHRPEDPEALSGWDNVSLCHEASPCSAGPVWVPCDKSCTSRGSDPDPSATSESHLGGGRHPARCRYS